MMAVMAILAMCFAPAYAAVWSGNGHDYLIIYTNNPIDSLSEAEGLLPSDYFLADIVSAEENLFIRNLIGDQNQNSTGYVLGAEFIENDGWYWTRTNTQFWDVTSGDTGYTNWADYDNDGTPEEPSMDNTRPLLLTMWGDQSQHWGFWNDEGTADNRKAIVAEAVPIPGALILFGTGLLGLFGINRRYPR